MVAAIRNVAVRADATAHCDDGPRRGGLELTVSLPEGEPGGALSLTWRDATDPGRSFAFAAERLERAAVPEPPAYGGRGTGRGEGWEGEVDLLLVAARVPTRRGGWFLALTLLASSRRSFFVEASGSTGAADAV